MSKTADLQCMVFYIVGLNDTALQEHYDEFFEEVFTELEDKVFFSLLCTTFVIFIACIKK